MVAKEKSDTEKREELARIEAELGRRERTEGRSGAVPYTPKQRLLDARDVAERHPDKHLRWVQVGPGEKATGRQAEGYVRLSEDEGGKQVGNLALFGQPIERHHERVKAQKQEHEARLKQHVSEVEQVAESVARELRQRGYNIRPEQFLIKEGS